VLSLCIVAVTARNFSHTCLTSREPVPEKYHEGKISLDFTEARDSEWQWYQLGRMQVCTSLQTDKHASTPPLSFLQAGCPSCHPANSIKAMRAERGILHVVFLHITENVYMFA